MSFESSHTSLDTLPKFELSSEITKTLFEIGISKEQMMKLRGLPDDLQKPISLLLQDHNTSLKQLADKKSNGYRNILAGESLQT